MLQRDKSGLSVEYTQWAHLSQKRGPVEGDFSTPASPNVLA
jgi:hypothetical protein